MVIRCFIGVVVLVTPLVANADDPSSTTTMTNRWVSYSPGHIYEFGDSLKGKFTIVAENTLTTTEQVVIKHRWEDWAFELISEGSETQKSVPANTTRTFYLTSAPLTAAEGHGTEIYGNGHSKMKWTGGESNWETDSADFWM